MVLVHTEGTGRRPSIGMGCPVVRGCLCLAQAWLEILNETLGVNRVRDAF